MTRRARITTVEQADAALESLGWLRGAGTPNREVRMLFDVAAFYRAELHRKSQPQEPNTDWQRRVKG